MYKLIENGHATTFLYKKENKELTLTGMDDDGWVFDTGKLEEQDWARTTGSANTYVYYICVDSNFIELYQKVESELKKTKTSYTVLWPNMWGAKTQYENCVSHCHYLMWKLKLAFWTSSKGWWMPSISNWVEWFKSFVPIDHGKFKWKYKSFPATNTHIP